MNTVYTYALVAKRFLTSILKHTLSSKPSKAMDAVKHPRWKVLLWDKNIVEPAMLRAPIVLIVFLVLWGVSLWVLEKSRVDYRFVLCIKSAPLSFVFSTAFFLAAQYAFNMTIFSQLLGLTIEAGVTYFYVFLACLLLIPRTPGYDMRSSFFRLVRSVLFLGNSVSFAEVLLADALTSVSKVLKDWGVTIIAVYAQFSNKNILDSHDSAMVLLTLLASIPYALRVRQCLVQLNGCNDNIARIPIILNIIKYCSSFPPIWLAAAASLGYVIPHISQLITVVATINSIYSFAWDIIMDWGLISFSRDGNISVRQHILLPLVAYVIVVPINLVLRFSWAINRVPGMEKLHSSVVVLVLELGEVVRRAAWAIFRIEWEVLVQQSRAVEKDLIDVGKTRLKRSESVNNTVSMQKG